MGFPDATPIRSPEPQSDLPRTTLALASFTATDRWYPEDVNRLRMNLWKMTCEPGGRLQAFSKCLFEGKIEGVSSFRDAVRQSKFVYAPRGLGADTFRTWETLILGAYPIVSKFQYMADVYDGLPVLYIDSYEDITCELLEETWLEFERRRKAGLYRWEKMTAAYWKSLFHASLES